MSAAPLRAALPHRPAPGTPIEADHLAAIEALHRATAIYTRAPIAALLVARLAWPGVPGVLVDPSCGDGVFLLEALRRLDVPPFRDEPERLAERLQGWEIHPGAAQGARDRVRAELQARGWGEHAAGAAAEAMVTTGDFLTQAPSAFRASALVGNPPYLRRLGVPALLRERYDASLPAWTRADLLHAFLQRCVDHLTPDGELALVTSDRWLMGSSAAVLREQLGTRVALAHLERLDAGSAFHRPKLRRAGSPARVHPVVVHLQAAHHGRALTRAPLYPDVWSEPAHEGETLGDMATLRLAPWLGPTGVFVVDSETAKALPSEHLVPAVDTDDIRGGVLGLPTRFALRVHPSVSPPPEIREHLARERHRLPPRARRSTPWMPPESWHRLDLSQESLLVPRIARGLKPIRVPAGVLPIHHNISIVAAGRASLDEIERMLNSPEADTWIRARAPMLEGGYVSICTSLLRQLPWPSRPSVTDAAADPAGGA
jgi:tRNA1(Val) A37 N6-methylase TrmN6